MWFLSNVIVQVDLGSLINPVNKLSGSLAEHVAHKTVIPQRTLGIILRHKNQLIPMEVDGSLVGAIFKSRVIPHLGLQGRFSDFVVTLNDKPFKGREPISTQPGWCDGAVVDVRYREETEQKPVGTT